MSARPEESMTLQGAVRQQINLGERDPLTIARKIANLYGNDWLAEQLAANWEDILAEIARQTIGAERRAAVHSLSGIQRSYPNKPVTKRDLMLVSLFVPKRGYIALGEATTADLEAAREYRLHLADGLVRWADWLGDVVSLMQEQGVDRVRRVKGSLPRLPGGEEPPLALEAGNV